MRVPVTACGNTVSSIGLLSRRPATPSSTPDPVPLTGSGPPPRRCGGADPVARPAVRAGGHRHLPPHTHRAERSGPAAGGCRHGHSQHPTRAAVNTVTRPTAQKPEVSSCGSLVRAGARRRGQARAGAGRRGLAHPRGAGSRSLNPPDTRTHSFG
ncbi:hypothetical protein ACFCYC_28120 [Streptomyces sp. NPDC056402]|uniref:hypothetical protein n=1 Tax=Streptomyces sp. NPDC056402 TaxID=3345810 RepID=UPI0035E16224